MLHINPMMKAINMDINATSIVTKEAFANIPSKSKAVFISINPLIYKCNSKL